MRKLFFLILVAFIFLSFVGCDESKVEKEYVDVSSTYNVSTGNNSFVNETVFSNNVIDMKIFKTYSFNDGYSLITAGENNQEYYIFLDDNLNVLGKYPIGIEKYLGTSNGKFYFCYTDFDCEAMVWCINYDGTECFEYDYTSEEFDSRYYDPILGHDGTILLTRKVAGYSKSCYQIAWLDGDGNVLRDFFDINYELSHDKTHYCGNGIVFIPSQSLYSGKDVLINLNSGNQICLNLEWSFGDVITGVSKNENNIIFVTGRDRMKYRIDDDGNATVVPKVNTNSMGEGLICKFENGRYSFCDYNMNEIIRLPENTVEATAYTNGKALVTLTGADGRKYVTLIDKSGNQLFEPIHSDLCQVSENSDSFVVYDSCDSKKILSFYNDKGKLISKNDLKSLGYNVYLFSEINDSKYIPIYNDDNFYNYLSQDGEVMFKNEIIRVTE